MTNEEIIRNWKKRNKLNKRDTLLLLEAYRRYFQFQKKKELSSAWVGLGMIDYDKSIYFRPVSSRPSRCLGWYRLSEVCLKVLSDLMKELPWSQEIGNKIWNNEFITDIWLQALTFQSP